MVRLPDEFIATKYNGYFFNTKNETLYSVKVGGELRPLRLIQPCYFNRLRRPAFYVSVNNIKSATVSINYKSLLKKQKTTHRTKCFLYKAKR